MLTKFETKSNRVKGLSFHPKRPWILTSLHSGVIQLWDYRMGTLIDRFDEHEGPVRGVHFHPSQPLFVSGGDDYKIKVWNYKTRRCLFTLLGHLDYIRTVQFHHESPWIVSASDDQTIRVWNWQSRSCIAVLTGHNHYVMCAQFHPREDLIASASLDQTVRVWDMSGLHKRSSVGGAPGASEEGLRFPPVSADLFGGGDAVIKYVLEGHDRGVNWVSFHPSLPLLVSGADDRTVKLWRMNDSKAWEVDTLRGHVNNVSCALFHARQDLVVSDSEDKSLRVWDLSKRIGLQTFRREHDRFWILAAHPSINLLAAGHDSGMIVFKLERERPAYVSAGERLLYVKDRQLRCYEYATGRDAALGALRRGGGSSGGAGGGLGGGARALAFSAADGAVLVLGDAEGGTHEVLSVPRDASGAPAAAAAGAAPPQLEARRGAGAAAAFVGRGRVACLDKLSGTVLVRDLEGNVTKKVPSPLAGADGLLPAPPGTVLLRSEERVCLYDLQSRAVLGELAASGVKYACWSEDGSRAALLSKHSLVVCDRNLGGAATMHETVRVKAAAWDPAGVCVYATLTHLKYALPNGDGGVLRTLSEPLYLVRAERGGVLHALDREAKPRTLRVDTAECAFKQALVARRYDAVLAAIRAGGLCGQAIISYLQDKGYPEVALHFVRDERVRFGLAVQCGAVDVALAAAQALDDPAAWARLGAEALRAGNVGVVEYAYQRTRAYDRLAFLYLITGALDKLAKMKKMAEGRGDAAGRLQAALFLGAARDRAGVLEQGGQLALAWADARTHGLEEEAARLERALEERAAQAERRREGEEAEDDDDDSDWEEGGGEGSAASQPSPWALPDLDPDAPLLAPPRPVLREGNWPLLSVSKGFFETLATKDAGRDGARGGEAEADLAAGLEAAGAGWGEDDLDADAAGAGDGEGEALAGAGSGPGGSGWDSLDLDLPPAAAAAEPARARAGGEYAPPSPGAPPEHAWQTRCVLAGEAAAAGAFEAALQLLRRQAGVVDARPLREAALELAAASAAWVPGLPSGAPMRLALEAGWRADAEGEEPAAPAVAGSLAGAEAALARGYRAVTEGKFAEARAVFQGLLRSLPLLVVPSRKEGEEARELAGVARDYALALAVETARREARDEPARAAALAAYFTHARLQPVHAALALRSAMSLLYKLRCFASCASMCRRLLDLPADARTHAQARQVLAACEREPQDALELAYDARNPFDVDALSLTPIYRGERAVEDPYTKARFHPDAEGQICPLGGISQIGLRASGLVNSRGQVR